VQNERKSEIKGEIPGRIERGLVRVDGGEATDFWRIIMQVWRAGWRSTELPSLSFSSHFSLPLRYSLHLRCFFDI